MCYQTAGRDAERRRNDTVQHPDHRPKTDYTSVRRRQVRREQRWGKRQAWRVQRWGMSSTARFLTPQGASHRAPLSRQEKKEETQHSNSTQRRHHGRSSMRGYALAYALDGGLWARGRV